MPSMPAQTRPVELLPKTPTVPREFGLDWLRVIAFAILIFYHTGMFFVPWGWHIKNPEQSSSLIYVMLFFNRWRLPLLFFISGAGVFFSLRRRSFGAFARERLARLGIPLVFGMLVIVPPQIYVERLDKGQFTGSYLAFWRTVFEGVPYPQGNLSWHHLWFVLYILTFSLLCSPLFAALRTARGRRALERIGRILAKRGVIFLTAVPSAAIAIWLAPHWPTKHNLTSDWANFAACLWAFLMGYVICGNRPLLDRLTAARRMFLWFALAMTVLFYASRTPAIASAWTAPQRLVVRAVADSWFALGWLLTFVSYSRAYLNRESPFLRYATEAVYPFYIVHQTVLLLIAYPMIRWEQPIAIKLPILAAGTFVGSWIIFELVRRTSVTRVLFGMKPVARPD